MGLLLFLVSSSCALDLSVVCDCVISRSYSLPFRFVIVNFPGPTMNLLGILEAP